MNQYISLNLKLSNSQLNKLKSEIKIETGIILQLSSDMISNFDYETNFLHKLLSLTNRQVANLCKAFANNLSANTIIIPLGLSAAAEDAGTHKKS